MKKIIIALAAVLIAGTGAFWYLKGSNTAPEYKTVPVTRGDIIAAVTATGTVNAVTTVLVGTQVSGTIKHIYADFNSPVKKGQLIAEIDPSAFEAQVEQAKANLLSAKANLDKAVSTQADAKRTLERNKTLFSKGLIARSDLDTAQTNYETASAGVSAAGAQAAQTEAALKLAMTNLRYTKIISPVDGIVVSRNVDVGQTVAASFQTPTLFTIAQDLTKMQIDSSVVEADIGKVSVGQKVDFTVDAYPDTTFSGSVSDVRIAPIIVQNVVTYDVVVKVANPEKKLKPGMTANISIVTSMKKGVLRVPNNALRFRPSGAPSAKEEKGRAVWVLKGSAPERVGIKLGITDGSYTEVASGGLKDGDRVITESLKAKDSQQPRGPRMF